MHPDERRDPARLRELVYRQVARDPRGTFDQLEAAQRRIRSLEAAVATDRSRIEKLTAQNRTLAASSTTTEERASESGAEPAGEGTRAPVDDVAPTDDGTSAAATSPATRVHDDAAATGPSNQTPHASSAGTEPTAEVEPCLEDVLAILEAEPIAAHLSAALNRLWYREGDITRAAELVDRHCGLLPDLTEKQRYLTDRILGTAALDRTAARLVPPRSRGAAYLPERQRILYCAYSTPIFHSNGYSVRTEGVVAGLKAAGADVTVMGRSGYPWDISTARAKPRKRRHVETRNGVDWVHVPEGNINHLAPDVYVNVAADAVVRQARLLRPSVIHAASNYLNALPALVAARRLGVPFVYEVRGLWEVTEASLKPGWDKTQRYVNQAAMETLVAREADAVLAITQEVADELVRRGVSENKITLLPNGVNTDEFLPLPRDTGYAAKRGIRTDVPVIGFAGSLVAYEGLDTLLQAANILRGRKVDFQVVIAGSGGVYPDLKSYQVRNKLQSRVKFVGRRPASEIARFMSCVDIVACPRTSLPVTEMVSPLKPLEAFSAAKPVVLSDVSPHRALVGAVKGESAGPRGLLSRAGNPKSLANALQKLIEDPELRVSQGQAGRLWAVDERQWRNLGPVVRRVYAQATADHDALAHGGRSLKDLRIGLIADEFTTETLRRSATIIPLGPADYAEQLAGENLDLVFVESAWSGNGGVWHHRVGYYSDEEHTQLRDLLARCRHAGIPTVFWNKEDPVHINRFRRTGALCDHVFTTDADMIPEYLHTARFLSGGRAVTSSSLPFYAQPAIHNPLPGARAPEDTIAYAGTYYGQRYPERSQQLEQLLGTAKPYGLAIYDRQLAIPDSPYRFPPEFRQWVRGALPYDEVIDSYRAHVASLNVNSAPYSPTMFSRRVVEIAACGGAVLSSWARGITETFDGGIPCTNNAAYAKALLGAWSADPEERLREVWLQLRTVLRAHTVDTALVILARTAGLPVEAFSLPRWGLTARPEQVPGILRQSVLPSTVRLTDDDAAARAALEAHGVRVLGYREPYLHDVEFWAYPPEDPARTWAEDLLQTTRWGYWDKIAGRSRGADEDARVFAVPGTNTHDAWGMLRATLVKDPDMSFRAVDSAATLTVTLPPSDEPTRQLVATPSGESAVERAGTILVAGHDLKFISSWLNHLRATGARVLVDQWDNHAHHDEQRSAELLAEADVVFCEWGLGNAIWYSEHVNDHQRLIVRVHAQELRGPYLRRIRHEQVSQYVFVSDLMREAAITSHGLPRATCTVIPNVVRTADLARDKHESALKTVGFVGIVPQLKRLDRAVDLMEQLVAVDPEFSLRVKGKRPEDYEWMHKRPEELEWYRACYRRVDELNQRAGREVIRFDPHGNDMAEWYRGVGYGISVSDHESFHLTLPDVAASGGVPVSLDWPGADLIYPREWLVPSVHEMAQRILDLSRDPETRRSFSHNAHDFTTSTFDAAAVHEQLDRALAPIGGPRS